jgi:hypothetical protein
MASGWVRFRDQVEAIIGLGVKYLVPIAAVAAGSLGLPVGAVAVLRAIPALMAVVEEAMPAPGSGPAKKQAVLNSAEALLAFIDTQLTGGASGSFKKLEPMIHAIIDGTIGAVNDLAPQIIADDTPKTGINAPVDSP